MKTLSTLIASILLLPSESIQKKSRDFVRLASHCVNANTFNVICLRTCHLPLTFTTVKGAVLLMIVAALSGLIAGLITLRPWTQFRG